MDIDVSDIMREELSAFALRKGSAAQAAMAVGVNPSTYTRWLKPGAKINDGTWQKCLLQLRPQGGGQGGEGLLASSFNGAPPPASSLRFVQALKRRPPMRPIVEAIVQELEKMPDMALARLLAELVEANQRKDSPLDAAADSSASYKPVVKSWLLFLPKPGGRKERGSLLEKLRGSAVFKTLRAGIFDWRGVVWQAVPKAEAAAFDDFLAKSFQEPRVMTIVERLLPASEPFGLRLDGLDEASLSKELSSLLPSGLAWRLSPWSDAAYSHCLASPHDFPL